MKKPVRSWILVLVIFICSPFSLARGEANAPVHLTILHLNDFHGHILPFTDKSISDKTPVGGASCLAQMIEQERGENPDGTLLFSAGDMFQGTPISNIFKGRPVIEIMNYLRFDALAIGNHEFDWGRDVLNDLRSSAEFPFISSNIFEAGGKGLEGVKPYIILTRKNIKIAVIGLTTTDTAYTTKPENVSDLRFEDPEKILPEIIREVRSRGAALVVVLSHMGLDTDKSLARSVSGIDVIVGGHSHTAVVDPVRVRGTIIVQAGCYGLYLGVLQLDFDPAKKAITGYTGKNELKTVFSGPGRPSDEKVARIVSGYNDRIKTEFERVVGESSVDLVRHSSEESNVGNLVADAMQERTQADVAFQNGGGLRADLPAGKITMEEVFTLLPFDNSLVVMDLTGSQILRILQQNSSSDGRMLQVSGLHVRYDSKAPVESEQIEATIGGKPLDLAKVYRVATNDFLAAGGDHFAVFKEGSNVAYDETVRDALIAYLKKHSPIGPGIENRISFVK